MVFDDYPPAWVLSAGDGDSTRGCDEVPGARDSGEPRARRGPRGADRSDHRGGV